MAGTDFGTGFETRLDVTWSDCTIFGDQISVINCGAGRSDPDRAGIKDPSQMTVQDGSQPSGLEDVCGDVVG